MFRKCQTCRFPCQALTTALLLFVLLPSATPFASVLLRQQQPMACCKVNKATKHSCCCLDSAGSSTSSWAAVPECSRRCKAPARLPHGVSFNFAGSVLLTPRIPSSSFAAPHQPTLVRFILSTSLYQRPPPRV